MRLTEESGRAILKRIKRTSGGDLPVNLLKTKLNWQDFEFQVLYCVHDRETDVRNSHSHDDYYELVVVREGNASHGFGGAKNRIGPGDVFLILPGETHYYAEARKLGIYNILFSRHFFAQLLAEFQGAAEIEAYLGLPNASSPKPRSLEIRHFDQRLLFQITELLDEILLEEKENRSGARLMVLGNALKLLTLICRHAKKNAAVQSGDAAGKIHGMVRELDRSFAEEWSLRSMAEASGFSIGGFRQQFRRIIGEPPVAWLLSLRLEKAAHLLRSSTLPVADVAERCGFHDSNYFSRQFHRKFGCSPRRFRQRDAAQ